MPACRRACFTSRTTHCRWCFAVSLGRKPAPGGAWYVCRRLARITGGFCGDGCEMMPIPSLLADPSSPRAIMMLGVTDVREVVKLVIAHKNPRSYIQSQSSMAPFPTFDLKSWNFDHLDLFIISRISSSSISCRY